MSIVISESLVPENQKPKNLQKGSRESIKYGDLKGRLYDEKLAEKKKIFNQCYDKLTD